MLAVKTILIVGLVLLWVGVSTAAEVKSPPDNSALAGPRKSGKTFLKPDLYCDPFVATGHFKAGNKTPRIGFSTYPWVKRPKILVVCAQLAEDLDQYQEIVGVQALQEALSTGVEFLYFSQDFATFGNPRLHTGLKFPWIESRNLRTGIYFSF